MHRPAGQRKGIDVARVRLFANLREIAGQSRLEIGGSTVGDVLDTMVTEYGDTFALGLETSKVWVNGDEADRSTRVGSADEVAVIPPVSGGTTAVQPTQGLDVAILAGAVIVLLAANTFGTSVAWFAAVLVGVVGLWAVDVTTKATARGLTIDPWPVLAGVVIGAVAAPGLGAAGMGLTAAAAVVMSLGWAVFRPQSRDLSIMGAQLFVTLIASMATCSLILARLSTNGDDKVAAFIVMAIASIVVTWLVGAMRRPFIDNFTAGAIAAVLAALLIASLAGLDLLTWFLTGVVMSVSFIAGRGTGAAIRTGEVYLAERAHGTLAALDGPVLAVTLFFPFLRLVG